MWESPVPPRMRRWVPPPGGCPAELGERLRNDPYAVVVGGLAFAAVALVGIVAVLPPQDRTQLLFEAAKAAIGVFPVAFFSVIVADLVRRRDAEMARKERKHEVRREFRREAIDAYNLSKATRRILRGAGLRPDSGIPLTPALLVSFDEQMRSLIEAQLVFERLKRELRSETAPFRDRQTLVEHLETYEKDLASVIRDWERGRPLLKTGTRTSVLEGWLNYAGFVADKDHLSTDPSSSGVFRKIEEALLQELSIALD